jgi:endonuclease/exonuclease/phosphatase family metal-dependent hydrolase
MKHSIINHFLGLVCILGLFQGCKPMGKLAQDKQASELNVMTFNIRLNTSNDGIDQWTNRKQSVKQMIEYAHFDVFGIQEGLLDQVTFLDSLSQYQREGVGRDDGLNKGEFSAVYFRKDRFTRLSGGTFWLSETPDVPSRGWDAALNRVCTYVRLQEISTQKTFTVFNTHFDHVGNKAREEAVGLMIRKSKEIAPNDPLIMMGDFNLTPESKPIQLLSAALKDAYHVAEFKLPSPEGTFNAFKPAESYKNRIDYIFVNNTFRVLRYATFTGTRDGIHFLSDHFPVWAHLAF